MTAESEADNREIFHRLATVEKEVYSMNKELLSLQSSKPSERLSALEYSVAQIKQDVINIEQISSDMSQKLGAGLDELKMQAMISRGQQKWLLGIATGLLAVLNAWPYIRELIKAAIQ